MVPTPAEPCRDPQRRRDIRASGWNGIDYVEVSEDRRTLRVFLLNRLAAPITPANVVIGGGTRVRDIQVTDIRVHEGEDPEPDHRIDVAIDRPGDSSTYWVGLEALGSDGRATGAPMHGIDPRYARAGFSFRFGEPTAIDCRKPRAEARAAPPAPEFSYLARDYQTFRQLIFDRLAVTVPGWQEQHVPDTGVALVEILAYAADRLSYHQDAVATEAYLATARQRISVKRHVRLIDYPMHEGCEARAWIFVETPSDIAIDPASVLFAAGYDDPSTGTVLSPDALPREAWDRLAVFEPLAPQQLHAAHNAIRFHTWGGLECCLPAGATSATLCDGPRRPERSGPGPEAQGYPHAMGGPHGAAVYAGPGGPVGEPPGPDLAEGPLRLRAGDVLLLEEVGEPRGGRLDPRHRHVVRLAQVRRSHDPLYDQPVVEVAWGAEDALPFPLSLSGDDPDRDPCVARGNVVLADAGAWTSRGARVVDEPLPVPRAGRRFRPRLGRAPLAFHHPGPAVGAAAGQLRPDPRSAVPDLVLTSIPTLAGGAPLFTFADLGDPTDVTARLNAPGDPVSRALRDRLPTLPERAHAGARQADAVGSALRSLLRIWTPQRDLLSSSGDDRHFVVEMDDQGFAHLRFGDDRNGRAPEAGELFSATYRIGVGPAGNVGAGAISRIISPLNGLALAPRNPLPAGGGTAPEPVAKVKLLAPKSCGGEIQRAVRPEDYARIAERDPRVQRAACELRWAGTGYEAHVAIDPLGTEAVDDGLLRQILSDLERVRRIGHEVVVVPATYVPLDIAMHVQARPGWARGEVETALRAVFSDRALPDGRLGFFHPDILSFGAPVYVSRLVAAAQAVAGVESVVVTRLRRRFDGQDRERDDGMLPIGPLEVARLGGNRASDEDGRFALTVRGGR